VVPPAWLTIPSTYVVCTDDRTLHPDTQRDMGRHATDVVTWDTSHSPMLSQPDLVADLLAELASRVAGVS
jgi:pimeloyl-ACP methyl ester carboxylesterase